MKQYNFLLKTTELQKLTAHLDERFNPNSVIGIRNEVEKRKITGFQG